ncbi:C4-dicarboxylate ABC transporter [Corynebacterium yudongzhengii]|uniref:C4-dicarboxylate ABC transporter n=1 Tax=Corynebacterium yudongzhengii TaxID=2080740 RepID=A0A2U1T8B6_9CORY|nr:TRAP transporter permease [Corynebacterium yudongzhengii]AWB82731.1 C4-dicarboxylate ABC transporter [Corynebacterium yudongzhengii]PWC02229.1 C4-dicarboxylate ABC transporter [Corynebacterium yudongzhengii]
MSSTATHAAETPEAPVSSVDPPNPRLTAFWKVVVIVLTLLGVGGTMNQVFFWDLFGLSLPTNSFLYLIAACFLPIVFIVYPLRKKDAEEDTSPPRPGVPWYDIVLIVAFIAMALWFTVKGPVITEFGWSLVAPTSAKVLSVLYWLMVLEMLRRAAGLIVAGLAALVSIYPMFAGEVPIVFLQGITYDPVTLAQVHVMGTESIHGLPLQTAATILVGFMLFGVVLQHTGGALFFNDLAMAIFGKFRGGSAKVSVASSASMGMMSGSAVSNVLTTGPMTIPAMVKAGFSPKTAGAVEATASSGGSITPPIMGTAAFLMVSFVGVPYTEVLVAATIPAILYFLGIYIQVDGYSALRDLRGTPKDLLPKIRDVLVQGWPYIIALALLTVMLMTMPSEAQVPFYAIVLLIGIALIRPSVTFGRREIVEMLLDAGKSLGQIIGIIAGVGLILGGLSATGVALSLSRDLIVLVGENLILILIAGAAACFVLGMGLTISAAYVFLAIVMAPAITAMGVPPIAAHLFIIYWASVSYITPPVGLAAFAAAGISKASPMGTSIEAMKFGAVKYIVPFGFVLNPALVAQGSLAEIAIAFVCSIVGVFALAGAFSGYVQFVEARIPLVLRVLIGVGGFLIFLPQYSITLAGVGLIAVALAGAFVMKRRAGAGAVSN